MRWQERAAAAAVAVHAWKTKMKKMKAAVAAELTVELNQALEAELLAQLELAALTGVAELQVQLAQLAQLELMELVQELVQTRVMELTKEVGVVLSPLQLTASVELRTLGAPQPLAAASASLQLQF